MRGERTEAGFTLIEMLVAIALLALIVGMLAGSIQGSRNVLAFIERNNTASALLPAQSYLRSALAQTVPAQLSNATVDRTPVLQGDAARVRFKTFYAPQGQIEGLYNVEVHLEPANARASMFDLVAIQTLLRPAGSDTAAPSRRAVLASNVRAVSFAYFGASDAATQDWQWFQAWSSAERLPRLVRVDVSFGPDQGRIWRHLEIPLQLSD